MATSVGSIVAKLLLDRDQFRRELEAARQDARDFPDVKVGVSADTARFDAGAAEVEAAKKVIAEPVKIPVELDEKTRLFGRLLNEGGSPADIGAFLGWSKADVAKALSDLNVERRVVADAVVAAEESIQADVAKRVPKPDAAGDRGGGAARAVGNAAGGLGGGAFAGGGGAAAAGGIAAAAGGAAAALIIPGVVPALAAAGVGLAAFAAAAYTNFSQISQDAMGMLQTFQLVNSGATMPAINGMLGVIQGLLTGLNPVVVATSTALTSLEGAAAKALGSPYWTQFFQLVAGEAHGALLGFGHLIEGLGTAFSGVTIVLAPLTSKFEADMSRWGASLSKFGGLAATGGIHGFVTYLQQNGPLAGAALKALGVDVLLLVKDLAPLLPVTLNVVTVLARLVGALESVNPVMASWALGLAGIGFGANRLLAPLGGLSGAAKAAGVAFKDLGNFSAIANGAENAAGPVGRLISTLGKGAGVADGVRVSAVSLGSTLGLVGAAVLALGITWEVLASKENAAKAQDATAAQAFVTGYLQRAQAMGMTIPQVEALIQAQIKEIAVSELLNGATFKQTDEIKNLKAALATLQGQQAGSTAVTAGAIDPSVRLASAITAMGKAASTTSTDISSMNTMLQVLAGNDLAAQAAVVTSQQAINTFATDIRAAHGDLSGLSQASLTAQSDALSFASGLFGTLIPALASGGKTTGQMTSITSGLVRQFDAAMRQAGLTAGQVNALNAQYHLTPKDVSTAIAAPGLTGVLGDVQALGSAVAAIPPQKSVAVNIGVTLSGSPAALAAMNGQAAMGIKLSHFAAGTPAAPGGLAWVGEQGPEAMVVGGKATLVGVGGPTIMDVPKGAQIIPADKTARLDRFAEGTGAVGGTVTYAPHYGPITVGSILDLPALRAELDKYDAGLVATLRQLMGVAG